MIYSILSMISVIIQNRLLLLRSLQLYSAGE